MTFQIFFVGFFVALIVSRIISNRALMQLSPEQKASLVDAFAGLRAYSLIPLVVIMVAYFALIQYPVMSFQLLTIFYLATFVIYIGWNFWFTRRRLRELDLPRSYLSQIGIARAVQYAGLAVFLVAVFGLGML